MVGSLSLGLGLTGVAALQKGGGDPLLQLFANGESGFLFDGFSDLTRLFTTSTGPTNVTADNDPVGLALDRSQWNGQTLAEVLAGQSELVTNGSFDSATGWALSGATISGGNLNIGSVAGGVVVASRSDVFTAGRMVLVEFAINSGASIPGGISISFLNSSDVILSTLLPRSAAGTFQEYATVPAGAAKIAVFTRFSGVTSAAIPYLSVKEVPGKHGIQATNTSYRPLWKENGGKPYLLPDGADDRLITPSIPAAAGTIAVAINCTAASGARYAMGGGGSSGNKRCRLGITTDGYPEFTFNDQFTTPVASDHRNTDLVMVMTWGGGARKAWIGSTKVIDESRAANMDGTGTPFALCSLEGGTSSFFQGEFYAALYRNALSTDAEVANIIREYGRKF